MKVSVLPCYCASLRQAARVVSRIYDNALRPDGLTITQFTVLELLTRMGSARILDMEEILAADQTTLTRNLAGMARAGWIKAEVGEQDRRERHWQMTAEGKTLYKQALPKWRSAQRKLERAHSEAFMKSLRDELGKLISDMA